MKYKKWSSHTQKMIDQPSWEINQGNQWKTEWQAVGTFERGQSSGAAQGQASGTAPPLSMDIDDLSSLFEQNTCLQGKVWHVGDESSTMQGHTMQMKRQMARMGKQIDQYEIS